MLRITTAACLTALVSGLSAQEFTDTFSVPSTSGAPGWTVGSGVWKVAGGRLQTDGATVWSYITKDGYTPLNCVLDLEAFYTPSGVQFAGLTARYANASSTLMCKIQENTTNGGADFDRSFVYERGGPGSAGTLWADLTTKVTTSAIIRMIVCGDQVWMKHDFDKDGTFDQTIGPQTVLQVKSAGGIGANMYAVSQIDNWEYHSAVLKPQTSAVPKIGTTFKLDLVTQATTVTPWRMAMSGGNAGISLGARSIPLTLDAIFDLSLAVGGALGLGGVTDSSGVAAPGLIIPNFPALVGVTLFAAAITADGSRPMGIGDISNEIAIKFTN